MSANHRLAIVVFAGPAIVRCGYCENRIWKGAYSRGTGEQRHWGANTYLAGRHTAKLGHSAHNLAVVQVLDMLTTGNDRFGHS